MKGKRNTAEQFYELTIPEPITGCLLWIGASDLNGYGRFCFERGKQLAHRVAWRLRYGEWPKQHLLHKCDTPACVNTDHLSEGSQADNMRDMFNKGRRPETRALKTARSHLSDDDVRHIRALLGIGWSTYEIAPLFGIKPPSVSDISTGKSFSWIK